VHDCIVDMSVFSATATHFSRFAVIFYLFPHCLLYVKLVCYCVFLAVALFLHVAQHEARQSNDTNSVSSQPLPKPASAAPPSMASSQSYPLSLSTQSSTAAMSVPHSRSQPVSVTSESEPQSDVDAALRILSSGSSLQTESARVMPLPGYGRSPLGLSRTHAEESSSDQVE